MSATCRRQINFVNFNRMVKSLCLAWIDRLMGESDDKSIPNYYFQNHGGLPFLLKCNYNVAVLNKGLPLFCRELLQYFEDFRNITNVFPNGEFILWNNLLLNSSNDKKFPLSSKTSCTNTTLHSNQVFQNNVSSA